MKIGFIFLFTILIAGNVFGQFFLGYTESELLINVEKIGGVKIVKGTNSSSMQYIYWQNNDGRCENNVFFENGKVWLYNIWPYDAESLDTWKNLFDRRYAKKSQNVWQAYVQGIGVDIKLNIDADQRRYFAFTLTKN